MCAQADLLSQLQSETQQNLQKMVALVENLSRHIPSESLSELVKELVTEQLDRNQLQVGFPLNHNPEAQAMPGCCALHVHSIVKLCT